MEELVDNEILISLVQTRPVLWDKSLTIYKNRNATQNAWEEICCELNKDFEDLEDKEKNVFGKAVIRRWTNLRDAFSKSKKRQQDCKKSGSGGPNIKKYVYNDQMQFLNKLYDSRETADSLENTLNNKNGLADYDHLQPALSVNSATHHNQDTNQEKNTGRFGNRKRRKVRKKDEIKLKMLKEPEPQKPNTHMSFFQGVMSHLSKFDDSEVLEFQMGVLQLISMIKERKKSTQPPTFPYHPQQFSAHQLLSLLNPQPSCSSYFNPLPNYQASFSQQPQLFHSQNNPFPNSTNQKKYTMRRESSVPQPTQSTEEYYQTFGKTSPATSPDTYPTDNPSPSPSGSSENTVDFATLN